MAQNAKQQLLDLLLTKNFEPQTLDSQGKPAPTADQATVFSFDYKGESGQDYGTVVVMVTDGELTIYSGDNTGKAMEGDDKNAWFNFLQQLKNFAVGHFMSFGSQNLNKLKYSMQGQAAIKEGLFEGWSGKKDLSYNADATQARLMIKHKRNIGEGEARFRYVESLFIETVDGERYKMPFKSLSAGKAMLEHVRQGGKPYDIRGQHITTIVNEMSVLARFRRANQGKIFEGETQQLVEQATHYYETLQSNLKSLSTSRGYSKYFESWDPAAITDEDVIIEDLRHMFVEQNIDSRIEQALPLLAKLKQQDNTMKEADIFESMMNLITEGTWALPNTKEKQAALVTLLSQEVPVGADATNATEQLYDLLGDDELFDKLHALAQEDANADARNLILDRLEELKADPDVAQVIGQLAVPQSPAADQAQPEEPAPQPPESVESPVAEEFTMESIQRAAGIITESVDRVKLDPQTGKPVAWSHEGDWEKSKNKDPRGQVTHLSDVERRKAEKVAQVNEFAPGGDNGGDEEHLRKLAKQWSDAGDDYDAQDDAEEALAKFGYGISEIEDGSEAIQLVPTGEYMLDWNDNDIIVFNPEDLAEMVKDPRTQTEDPPNTLQPKVTPNTLSEDQDGPVAGAITRRILLQHSDLLKQYGPKAVTAAIDNVADYVGDVEEIGSSDVSGWVNQVERMLKENPPEAFDESQVNELSPNTLKSYIKKAGGSSHERSASNLASRAADKLHTGDQDDVDWDDGADDDHKSFMRSKGIAKAVDRLEESGMSEVDLLLQDIARGDVDIYNVYANPKSNIEQFVSKQIHEKAEEVAREQGYHLDDDIEDILARIQRELEVEYGADDNMEIELEESLADFEAWANTLVESEWVSSDKPLFAPTSNSSTTPEQYEKYRAQDVRKKKQDILKQIAQLGEKSVEFIWAGEHNVFMNKDQILDYLDQTVADPDLTALEYMHNNGYSIDGLLKGMLKSLVGLGVKKADIFSMFKSARRGETNPSPGMIGRVAKQVVRDQLAERLDSYKHMKPNMIKPQNNKIDVASQKFPDPAEPYIENGKVVGIKGPNGEKRPMSKSHTVGDDGKIYHFQDPRAHASKLKETDHIETNMRRDDVKALADTALIDFGYDSYDDFTRDDLDYIATDLQIGVDEVADMLDIQHPPMRPSLSETVDANSIPLSTWVEEVRDEVESGRDIDDVLQDLEARLENEFDADEDTIRNIIGDVELNLGDLRYGDDLNEGTALKGQYGHSGKLEAVKGTDQDMMERIKFLAGLTK